MDCNVPLESATTKFIFGSFSVFDELQSNVISANSAPVLIAALNTASALYKSKLEIFSQDLITLQDAAAEIGAEDAMNYLNVEVYTAENIFKLWSLCDICLLNQRLGSEVMNWLQISTLDINVEQYAIMFQRLEYPENKLSDGESLGFYEVIESLVLSGRLSSAWTLLSQHSEIRNTPESSVDVAALQGLFLSHPYPTEEDPSAGSGSDGSSGRCVSVDEWRSLARKIRATQRILLDNEMSQIFDIFEGNVMSPVILDKFSCWEECALALMLYTCESPFSLGVIVKTFDQAMRVFDAGDPEKQLQHSMVKAILRGEPGPPIRFMTEQSSMLASRALGGASVVSLVSTAHLAQLIHLSLSCLTAGEEGLEGGILWPQNEVGIVEELFLQSAERLFAIGTSAEIFVAYCMACPLRGLHFAHALLSRVEINSDEDVHFVCGVFSSLDLDVSARVAASSRGTWWLKRCRNAAKAMLFYCLASDRSKAAALLEDVTWSLVQSVARAHAHCVGTFRDLKVNCPQLEIFTEGKCSSAIDESTLSEAIDSALIDAESVLDAYTASSTLDMPEKELFVSTTRARAVGFRCYVNLVKDSVGSDYTLSTLASLRGLADSTIKRDIPLRLCLHFIDVAVYVEGAICTNQVAPTRCCLTVDQVEGLLLILHRVTVSPHSYVYLAGTDPSVMKELYTSLLDMSVRALFDANEARARLQQDRLQTFSTEPSRKNESLLGLIIAS